MTRAAFENAIVTVVMVLGGPTNAVLHLIAMAKSIGVKLTQDDFQSVSNRIPVLVDMKPSGKYMMEDLHNVGGVPAVMKYLLKQGLLHGECLTVTGKTIAENLVDVPGNKLRNTKSYTGRLKSRSRQQGIYKYYTATFPKVAALAKISGQEGTNVLRALPACSTVNLN